MPTTHLLILFVMSICAGIVNAIAGGGSVLTYPLLVNFGVLPVSANATSSVAIIFGVSGSAFGYKKYITRIPKHYFAILVPCFIGGFVGAFLLRKTPDRLFTFIVPWFFLLSALLISAQPYIHTWIYEKKRSKAQKYHERMFIKIASILILLLAVLYGGYFGIGFGIIMLGLLGLSRLKNLHEINGLKNLSALAVNITAVAYFAAVGLINWSILPPLVLGNIIGGWVGATYSDRFPTRYVRIVIVFITLGLAVVFFINPQLR